jgi:hypothetical protein
MAEQGFVLDIDTTFLNNLRMADKALAKSVMHAKYLTTEFHNMVGKTGPYAQQINAIHNALAKLGSGSKMDFSQGIVKISTDSIAAIDKIHLLVNNLNKLRQRSDELKAHTSIGMFVDDKDFHRVSALMQGLKDAREMLRTGKLELYETRDIAAQIELYKAAIKELTKTDEDRTKDVIKEVNERIRQSEREAKAALKNRDAYYTKTPAKALNFAEQAKSLEELKRAYRYLEQVRDRMNPDTKTGQKNIANLNKAMAETKNRINSIVESNAKLKGSFDGTSKAALNFAKQAKSLEELKRAYRYLEQARDRINPDTRIGQERIANLNKAMAETKNKINNIAKSNDNLKGSFDRVSIAANQLKSIMGAVFGLTAIKNFASKLISVRGEFEMIQKSLEVLLRSSAKAEAIWKNITSLALKSPFKVQELATATKQMAAYGIEADQLYHKTKMLADISAGLGVEMSRLILAYGQVKAANFLRGTELRQFTEAGIDMLGQLSAYFTEIEGRAVTTAEVFERISKRMVLFEDVDQVLTRITSRGGTFYKMQEEQSKTLRGNISNLKDEIALMFNEIGESNSGALLFIVKMIRSIVEHWRVWLPLLTATVSAFIAWKASGTVLNGVLAVMELRTKFLTARQRLLQAGLKGVKNAAISAGMALKVMSNSMNVTWWAKLLQLIFTVVSALSALGAAVSTSLSADSTGSSETLKIFEEESAKLTELTGKIDKYNAAIDALEKSKAEQAKTDANSLSVQEQLNILYSERSAAVSELASINNDYVTSLANVLNSEKRLADPNNPLSASKALAKDMQEYAGYVTAAADTNFEKLNQAAADTVLAYARGIEKFGYITQEQLEANSKKAQEAYEDQLFWYRVGSGSYALKAIDRYSEGETFLGDSVFVAPQDDFSGFQNFVKNVANPIEHTIATVAAVEEAFGVVQKAYSWIGDEIFEASTGRSIFEALDEKKEIASYVSSLDSLATELGPIIGVVEDLFNVKPGDLADNDELRKEVQRYFRNFLLTATEIDPEMKKIIQDRFASIMGFTWVDDGDELEDWQKRYNGLLSSLIKSMGLTADAAIELSSALNSIKYVDTKWDDKKKDLEEALKLNKEIIEAYEGYPAPYKSMTEKDQTLLGHKGVATTFSGLDIPRLYTSSDYGKALQAKDVIELLLQFEKIDKETSEKNNYIKEILKSMEDVHKAYKTMQKTMSDDVAIFGAWDRYGDVLSNALSKIGMSVDAFKEQFGDLASEDEFTQALEWLATRAQDASERMDIQRVIGEYKWELIMEEDAKSLRDITKQIDDLFTGYELSIELDKLNVPKDFASSFFNVDITSLDQLRSRVADVFTGIKDYNSSLVEASNSMETMFDGNVDLLNRKIIPAQKLAEKGWEDVGEGFETLFTQSYHIQDAGGETITILATPILPDGSVLSSEELEEYVTNTLQGTDIKATDAAGKGVVVHVGVEADSDIQTSLDKWQEAYYAKAMMGKDDIKEYEDYLSKIDELETKSQQERLKKYVEYSKLAMGERAKILMGSVTEIEDINKTFSLTNSLALNKGLIGADVKNLLDQQGKSIRDIIDLSDTDLASKWGFTTEQISALREFNSQLLEQRDIAIEASKAKSEEKMHAVEWDELKESSVFMSAMQDLDRVSSTALDKLISNIQSLKSEWVNMPYSEVKEMVSYLEKLESAKLAYDAPDEVISNSKAAMAELKYTSGDEARDAMFAAEEQIALLNEELAIVEMIESRRQNNVTDEAIMNELLSANIASEIAISNAMSRTSATVKSELKAQKDITSDASKYLRLVKSILDAHKEKQKRLKDIKQVIDKIFDGWDAVNSLFEEGSMSSEIANLTKGVSNIVFESLGMVEAFKAAKLGLKDGGTEAEIFGYKLNMAMGIIGWIVMAIQLIAKGLKFAFEMHDKKRQEQIDAEMEKLEKLQKEYEKLEKAIADAYTATDLNKYTSLATKNLNDQIASTKKLIALEEDKKKSDDEAIKEWKDSIEDMEEQLEELIAEKFSKATDGVLDDVLSATDGFVNAWHDAFKETGDGISGLQDEFNEMFANILKRQASLTLISPMIEQFKGELERYMQDSVLSENEALALRDFWDSLVPRMNDSLKTYFDIFSDILEVDYGELSGLEKGIQGMTEDQAEVLASYWNSCRFMLSSIDNNLASLASHVLTGGNAANPMLVELKEHTRLLESIDARIASIIGIGGMSSHSLSYIRVNDA